MFIDLTLQITPEMTANAQENLSKARGGHLGTHFDVMDKEFPLDYAKREGIAFDVSSTEEWDITVADIDMDKVRKGMFVLFYSGFIEKEPYGSKAYFSQHPALSWELIESLTEKEISLIGVDFSGMRNGSEHTAADRFCADRGVFVVENMVNLKAIIGKEATIYTFPLNFAGLTGLPCRVLAECQETLSV